MLMVVFGAGASYDSYPSLPPDKPSNRERRPPLASQLFDERPEFVQIASSFPDCLEILPFLRHVPAGKTIEAVLEDLQGEAKENPRRHAQLAAVRHYIRGIIKHCEDTWVSVHRGVTNFRTLLGEIEAWRTRNNQTVCLVTFNYDTMVEVALSAVNVKISKMNDYVSQHYALIKLHGSVNWGHVVGNVPPVRSDVDPAAYTKALIDSAGYYMPRDDFRFDTSQLICASENLPLIPALAIPIVQKLHFECPEEHLKKLDVYLPKISKLLIVGWRANERHFIQKMSRAITNPLRVMIVSGSAEDVNETIKNLTPVRLQVIDGYQREETGFSRFILDRSVVQFLRS